MDPADYHRIITPGAAEIDPTPSALAWSTAGTVTIIDAAGTAVEYNMPAGTILSIRPRKITAASATLIAWWLPQSHRQKQAVGKLFLPKVTRVPAKADPPLQYINGFYNPRRRHASLNGKSPVAFEKKAV